MARIRFLWKLYFGYVVLILLTVSVLGILISRAIEQDSLQELRDTLLTRATLLRGTLAPQGVGPAAVNRDRVRDLGRATGTRITIIAPDGHVAADSEEDPDHMDNHGTRPEVLQAISHGVGEATRFSNTLKTRMMYVAVPVMTDGAPAGCVRVSLPLTEVEQRLSRIRGVVLTGALIVAFIALPIGYIVARRFTAPLGSMTQLARDIADGDYKRRVQSARGDEIGELADALNAMAREAEGRLQSLDLERNQLRAILSGMVEGVIAVDADRILVHINGAAAKMFGIDPLKVPRRPIREITRATGIAEAVEYALANAQPTTRELQLVREHRTRTIDAYASPLLGADDTVIGAVVVMHDVTDLRHLESVRRDFVANVSHELKTPITAMQGLIETMQSDTAMPPETREQFLARVQNQIARLGTLVGDLLVLSRLESTPQKGSQPPTIDLRDAVSDAVSLFGATAESRGITLTAAMPQSPLPVAAEAGALEQIISNLLDNALKYTDAGGRVTVTLEQLNGQARLTVADTGIGIDPVHRDRIFERFYRVDRARSRALGGTGLGLAIVKHCLHTLGGTVEVTSTPGVGTTFTATLPLSV